jgi:hypothetical protein
MKAGSLNLQKLFTNDVCYLIPLFQRPYVWTKTEKWEPLWEDIRILAERRLSGEPERSHFVGAVVLEQLPVPTGDIEKRQVIDGQQRLITFQILLTVLRDLSAAYALKSYEQKFAKFTRNDPVLIRDSEEAFKVWPTNPDRVAYRLTLEAGGLAGLLTQLKLSHRKGIKFSPLISTAYTFFAKTIQSWIDEPGSAAEARMDALWCVLIGQLRIVTIDLEAEDDAQLIFETLNSKGTPLLPADLVKNFLFRQAEQLSVDVERLYQTRWRSFDTDFWREEIRQGRLKRPRLDIFFQHYLSLKTRDDVLVTHIFETYKRYAQDSGKAPEELINDLDGYASVFKRFSGPHSEPVVGRFFSSLAYVDTATVYPVLLEVFHLFDNDAGQQELQAILRSLESFLVRRMACRLTTKNYNRFFLELLNDADKHGGLRASQVQAYLLRSTKDTNKWPNDAEFTDSLTKSPLYERIAVAKVRMILERIDRALDNKKTETIVFDDNLSVEHLLPQVWQTHWPLPGNNDAEKIAKSQTRDFIKHTIGNLTLLTDSLNSAISMGPWAKKRPEILKQSKLNLNREFHEALEWNEDSIRERGERLGSLAVTIWPYPGMVNSESEHSAAPCS